MPTGQSSGYDRSMSRKEQIKETMGDHVFDVDMTTTSIGRNMLQIEEERLYACYAADSDRTQAEANELITTHTDMSQSTVSRLIREMDTRILTEPVRTLHNHVMAQSEIEQYERISPDYVQKLRQLYIRAIMDLQALQAIGDAQKRTPEWAQDRFPDLRPDIGQRYGDINPAYDDDMIHE